VDPLGREHVGTDRLHRRHQAGSSNTDPIGEGADVDLHPFSGVDRALPGERQMLAVLGRQHQGEQMRAGTTTGDRVRRGRRLADPSQQRQETFSRTCSTTFQGSSLKDSGDSAPDAPANCRRHLNSWFVFTS
jgi:hypothetical protein